MRTGFFRVLAGVSAFRWVRGLGTQTPSVSTASLLQRPTGDSTRRPQGRHPARRRSLKTGPTAAQASSGHLLPEGHLPARVASPLRTRLLGAEVGAPRAGALQGG